MFRNPFDANKRLKGCPCGAHASAEEHRLATAVEVPAKPLENEGAMRNIVETALMRAIFSLVIVYLSFAGVPRPFPAPAAVLRRRKAQGVQLIFSIPYF